MADGFSAAEIDSAASFVEAGNAFGKGQMRWAEYGARLISARRAKWFDRVEKPTAEDAPTTPFYRSAFGRYFDPLSYWANITAPVFAIYGGLDTTVPAQSSAPLLSQHSRRIQPLL